MSCLMTLAIPITNIYFLRILLISKAEKKQVQVLYKS
jgi:hypothetical protein